MRLLLAILLTLVIVAGSLAVAGAIGKYQESCREQERQELAQRRRHERLAHEGTRLAVLGFGRDDWDKQVAAFTRGIEQIHSGTNEANEAECYCARGCARCAKGEWNAAIADLTEAMRLDQIAPVASHNVFRNLDPRGALAYRCRGFAHCATEEWEAAVADLTEAIRLNSTDARAYAFRSFAHGHQGNTEKAQDDRAHANRLGFTPHDFAGLAEVLE